MTALKHARYSLWQRDEHGAYRANLNGWSLLVKWIPMTRRGRGAFVWEAERPDSPKIESRRTFEELEMAMVGAEEVAEPDPTSAREIDKAGAERR